MALRSGSIVLMSLILALAVSAASATGPRMLTPGGASYGMPVTTLKGARFLTTLEQQYDFSCGSAAVATLLTHHYDHPVSEAAVFQHMFARGDQARIQVEGFSMLDMKRYLDAQGFHSEGIEASLDLIAEAGVPAIALMNENGYMHFVVVKGLREKDVVLGDPAMGTRVMPREQFETYWTNGILLVIGTHIEIAQFNLERDWRIRPRAPITRAVSGFGSDMLPFRRGPMDH